MSLRPRYGGDGQLRLPDEVRLTRPKGDDRGDVLGGFGGAAYDPFERDAEGLLLAESFARLDLADRRAAREWFLAHGVLDLASYVPEDYGLVDRPGDGFRDELRWISTEQTNVHWHLYTLADLSEHRQRGATPAPDREPHEGWDAWLAQPALACPVEIVWLGAPDSYTGHIWRSMIEHERWEDAPNDQRPRSSSREKMREIREEWWPKARAGWAFIERFGLPILTIPRADWLETWRSFRHEPGEPVGRVDAGPLHRDWLGVLDLQRLLLAPHVRRASVHDVVVERDGGSPDEAAPGATPIRLRERRLWRSILAPVYLQLFEGLRRVSEGHSGAARCRECGQAFLTLDARRSSFCNDRERFRWSQRQRRERLRSPDARYQPPMPT